MTMSMSTQKPVCHFQTALGTCAVSWSELGIREVLLPGAGAPSAAVLGRERVPASVGDAIAQIVALLDGEPRDLRDLLLDETGVGAFRRAVYAATRRIGPGETATYGEIAREIGEPGAAREVGAALGRNRFPIVVPCHRVLAADGSLHGFSAPGGIETKRRMLAIEGAPGFAQQALFA
jgi:methylated-DNA-[protein]-cysteine S-methyltransferase